MEAKRAKLRVADLFTGAGGLSLGFAQKDFELAVAVEFDPDAAATCRAVHEHPSLNPPIRDGRSPRRA